MKKTLFICLLVLLCSCQFTKQQKAEKLVKNYLKAHLNDPDSYESISFEKLDINPYAYEDTITAGIALKEKEKTLINQNKGYEAKSIRKFLDSIDFIYPNPIIKSYLLAHKYRAKNAFGGIVTTNSTFVFNNKCDSILFETGNN